MHVDQLPDVHKQVVNLSNEWSIATYLIIMTSREFYPALCNGGQAHLCGEH